MAATADGWRRQNSTSSHASGPSYGSPATPEMCRITASAMNKSATLPRVTLQGTFLEGWQGCPLLGAGASSKSAPSLHRLPQLSKTQGSWSMPNLERDATQGPSPKGGARLLKAQTLDESNWKSFSGNQVRRQSIVGGGDASPSKSTSRWNANPGPTMRQLRNDVLQKDRQRQRDACNWDCDMQRNFASPARSHAASLFFGSIPGAEDAASTLSGPFRKVARPQTRQMIQRKVAIDPVPTTMGEEEKNQPDLTRANTDKSGQAQSEASQRALLEKKANDADREADLLFSADEHQTLTLAIEKYVDLISPPGKEADPLVAEAASKMEPSALSKTKTAEMENGLFLRPLYCRFLLASELCGQGQFSWYQFQEQVAAFDAKSAQYGAFLGTTQADILRLIARMLVPSGKGIDAAKDESLRRFFDRALPRALRHWSERRDRLDAMMKRTRGVVALEIPNSVLEEVDAHNIWPPLPSRKWNVEHLSEWGTGVKQWEEALTKQNAPRLLALRAYSDAVVQGEMLTCQLLEPEVLHFATRFCPLFKNLFEAYSDWPAPDEEGFGHMSFTAFFRFCVDFSIFPMNANFEEIKNIYNTAEAVRHIESQEEDVNFGEEEEPEEAQQKQEEASVQSPMSPASGVLSPKSEKGGAGRKRVGGKKMAAMVEIASAAAVAVSEDRLQSVDLRFFERPMALMNEFEIKTVAFFASVDEWFSERRLRLHDIIVKGDMDEEDIRLTKEAIHEAAKKAAMREANIDENGAWIPTLEQQDKPGGGFRNKDEEATAIRKGTQMANASVELATACVSQTVCISASGFLKVIEPMKTPHRPPLADVERMFRLLCAGPDENGRYDVEEDPEAKAKPQTKAPVIPVFHVDKVVRKAQETMDKARRYSCSLLRVQSERTEIEQKMFKFFEEIYAKLLDRSQFMPGGYLDDVFSDVMELTPEAFLAKATDLGIDSELHPTPNELAELLLEVVGRRVAPMNKRLVYRAIAFMMEGRRRQEQLDILKQMQCQTHRSVQEDMNQAEGPQDLIFGLSAFAECLLKLAIHRLGFKAVSDIQRGSPAWWKCTWLLTLLQTKFSEKITCKQFENKILDMAMGGEEDWHEGFLDGVGVGILPSAYCANSWLTQNRDMGQSVSASSVSLESTSLRGDSKGNSKDSKAGRSSKRMGSKQSSGTVATVTTVRPRRGSTVGGASVAGASSFKTSSKRGDHKLKTKDKSKRAKRSENLSQLIEKGPNLDAEVWWRKVQIGKLLNYLPRNVPAMEHLVGNFPDLFEPCNSEKNVNEETAPQFTLKAETVQITQESQPMTPQNWTPSPLGKQAHGFGDKPSSAGKPCERCGEMASASGWGNPSCIQCSGVEEHCFPISQHIFGELLRTYMSGTSKPIRANDADVEKPRDCVPRPPLRRSCTTNESPLGAC